MKGERKLRLVPVTGSPSAGHDGGSPPTPPSSVGERGGEPPFSDDELAAAADLREAIERGDDPLANELRAAASPGELDAGDLDAILARALGEGDAPPTRAERLAADRLRDALAGELHASDGRSHEIALAAELRAAHRPRALDPAVNDALVTAALQRAAVVSEAPGGRVVPLVAPRAKARRIAPRTMAALAGIAALAASVALLLGRPAAPPSDVASSAPAPPAAAELIRARSTQELFDAATPFPRKGEESARIDRITSSRAADLRKNRFAAWGVR